MIYVDSSALLKLLVEESESDALATWLSERPSTPIVSSALTKLEVIRAARRVGADVAAEARALVSRLDLIPLSSVLLDQAADVGERVLRSLDAIHLTSALSLGTDLTAFVAYDQRLLVAARAAGVPVSQPGSALPD